MCKTIWLLLNCVSQLPPSNFVVDGIQLFASSFSRQENLQGVSLETTKCKRPSSSGYICTGKGLEDGELGCGLVDSPLYVVGIGVNVA